MEIIIIKGNSDDDNGNSDETCYRRVIENCAMKNQNFCRS